MTRQQKTPRQRAQEALAVAERKVLRAEKRKDELDAELRTVKRELAEATRRRDYAAQDPALPRTEPDTDKTPKETAAS